MSSSSLIIVISYIKGGEGNRPSKSRDANQSHVTKNYSSDNWKVKEKTVIKPLPPPLRQPSGNSNNCFGSYSRILDNIKHLNKRIVENNQELMSIQNMTDSAYFLTSSGASSQSSFQVSSASTGSTSSFSSLSEFSTANRPEHPGNDKMRPVNASILPKETKSVALSYYHHLFNQKLETSKYISLKKSTQPLYKVTCKEMTTRNENAFNCKPKITSNYNCAINKITNDKNYLNCLEVNKNTNKIFRQETVKKLQFQPPVTFKR